MEKRVLIAILLSFVVFFGYTKLVEVIYPDYAKKSETIQDHAVTGAQVVDLGADGLDDTGDLVAEDLRLARQRNGPPPVVGIVVGLAAEDVEVGAAEPHRAHPDDHVPWPAHGALHVGHLEPPHITEDAGPHAPSSGGHQ